MIEIIKPGRLHLKNEEQLYRLICSYCGCEFKCTADEVKIIEDIEWIMCPYCGKMINT